jgi:isopenicillin-N epimerase
MAASVHGMEVSLDEARDLFSLDPQSTHLNHGSFGAVPIPVQRAQQRLREEMEANPMAFFTRGLADRIAHTRRHIATFLGCDPDLTALVPNATAACQIVLNSVATGTGSEVLLTDHAYGVVGMAVRRLCERTGATAREVPVGLHAADDEIVAGVAAAARPGRTRLAVIDHVTSPTARLFPVARIVSALRALDVPVLVDAAHAPGMLPTDVSALGADFWLGNLHKWAFAPRPTAVLAASEACRPRLRPLVVSWRDDDGFPDAVEFGGTLDYTPWLAAPAGLHLLRTIGVAEIRRHNASLAAYGQRVVAGALGLDPDALPQPRRGRVTDAMDVSMRLVPLPPGVAADRSSAVRLRERIAAELSCEVALDAWNGTGYLRLSAQIYNRSEDYDRLAAGLPALLRSAA